MNKSDIETDFKKRYGNGNMHTCFVPIPLTILGSECYQYGGGTLIIAMSAGVWVCAGLNSLNKITIGSTSDNLKTNIPLNQPAPENIHPAFRFISKLASHFCITSGVNILFHCDIPKSDYINTEISYLLAAAIIMKDMFAPGDTDIISLIEDFAENKNYLLASALLSARKKHAVYINGKEKTTECVPICHDNVKILCSYPSKKHNEKPRRRANLLPPLPLNDLKLDALPDKSGILYLMTRDSHNTFAAYKSLKNNGINDFFNTFSEKNPPDGCLAAFSSDTNIYFVSDNNIDYVMSDTNRHSNSALSFIITDCSDGASIK